MELKVKTEFERKVNVRLYNQQIWVVGRGREREKDKEKEKERVRTLLSFLYPSESTTI